MCCEPPKKAKNYPKLPEGCIQTSLTSTSPAPTTKNVPRATLSSSQITGCLANPKFVLNKGDCYSSSDCDTGYKSTSTGYCCVKNLPAGCIQTSLTSASETKPPTSAPSTTPPLATSFPGTTMSQVETSAPITTKGVPTTSIPTITKKSFNNPNNAPDQGVSGCLINSNLGNIPKNDCVFKFGKYVSPSMGNAECKQPEVAPAECFNTTSLTTKPVNTPVPVITQKSPDQGVSGCLLDAGAGNISKNSCELAKNGKYYSTGSQCKDPLVAPDLCFKPTKPPVSAGSRSSVNPEDDPEYVARVRRAQYDKMMEDRRKMDEELGITTETFGSMTKTHKTLIIVGSMLGALLLLILIIKMKKK